MHACMNACMHACMHACTDVSMCVRMPMKSLGHDMSRTRVGIRMPLKSTTGAWHATTYGSYGKVGTTIVAALCRKLNRGILTMRTPNQFPPNSPRTPNSATTSDLYELEANPKTFQFQTLRLQTSRRTAAAEWVGCTGLHKVQDFGHWGLGLWSRIFANPLKQELNSNSEH